jgi:uncharacterized protein YgiM (DUF1202 family)
MKRTIRAPFLFLLMLSLLLPLIAGAEPGNFTVGQPLYLNTGAARPVYQSAGSASGVIRELSPNEAFELVTISEGWAEILVINEAGERLAGWTLPEGIRPKGPEDGFSLATVNSPDPYIRVPLREQPRDSAKSLGKYYNGVTALVLEQPQNAWVKVRIGDLEGWFEQKFLAMDAPTGSVASFIPTVTVSNPDDPGLNLRSAQSFQSETKTTYSNGKSVRVLGVTEDFVHVLTEDGLTGFMMAWGVTPQPAYADIASAGILPQPEGIPTVVDNPSGQGANLRKRASTGSDSLGLYRNGTSVIVTGGDEYWKQVCVEGKTGWMMAKMLKGMQPVENGE